MKKLVSLFLVAMLCLAMIPMQAFAAESEEHAEDCTRVEQSKGGSSPHFV